VEQLLLAYLPPASLGAANPEAGMRLIDWGVVVAYGVGMLGIGWFYSRRARTAEDYHLAGRRERPWLVGISLFATLLSSVSYLAYPGEMIKNGPMILAGYASFPLVMLVVGWLLIPYIMRFPVTRAYELPEMRLGFPVRMLGTTFFLALRLLWMGVIIYTMTSTVLIPVAHISPAWAPVLSAALAFVTLAYTAMGGLKAVIITDVVQTFILFAGVIASLALITSTLGGVSAWFPSHWDPAWAPPRFWFDTGTRITFAQAATLTFLWWVCTCGSDQLAIQRYLATRDVRAARRALAVSLCSDFLVNMLLAPLGFAVLAFFRARPDLLPAGHTVESAADELFPRFIAVGLPAGFSGLAIAGLLAAAMSSLSSGVNSSSTVLMVDVIERLGGRRRGGRQHPDDTQPAPAPGEAGGGRAVVTAGADGPSRPVRLARLVSWGIGVVVVLLSLLMDRVSGNLLEVVSKIANLFVAPLFLLFFMAMFVPWATTFGTVLGALAALAVASAIAVFSVGGLSFTWILPFSLLSGIAVGIAASVLPVGARPPRPLALE
jgi:SSS family solute:Na+ symporter